MKKIDAKKNKSSQRGRGASKSQRTESTGLIRRWLKRGGLVVGFLALGFVGYVQRHHLTEMLPLEQLAKIKLPEISISKVQLFEERLPGDSDAGMDREIKHIELLGDFQHVSKVQLSSLLEQYLEEGFFKTDIKNLKVSLEAHPWIASVNIARQWPDTLKVSVVEEQAIARWDTVGFLNQKGEVVVVDALDTLSHLPLLSADNRFSEDVMQQYLRVSQLLWPHELTLAELHLDETLAWTLVVDQMDQAIEVKLGKDNILEKLQALLYAKQKQLKKDFRRVAVVDMRYEKGFAVSWQPEVLALVGETQ